VANGWNGAAGSNGEAWWDDGDVLLAELDDALRTAREIPASFIAAGQTAFSWLNIDAELATLAYDSAAERGAPVGALTRSEAAPLRALTFASPRLSVHLEVVKGALHGQVVPAQAGEMEVRPVNGPNRTVRVDDVGWFVLRPLPACSFRLRCCTADGVAVITDWIVL
jgi:hypothetical protein